MAQPPEVYRSRLEAYSRLRPVKARSTGEGGWDRNSTHRKFVQRTNLNINMLSQHETHCNHRKFRSSTAIKATVRPKVNMYN